MTKPKYTRGPAISTLETAVSIIADGRTIWFNDKPRNAAFTRNWTIHTVDKLVKLGILFFAIPVGRFDS